MLIEKPKRAAEAVAAKPAKDFLRHMSKKHKTERQAKDRHNEIDFGVRDPVKHERLLTFRK